MTAFPFKYSVTLSESMTMLLICCKSKINKSEACVQGCSECYFVLFLPLFTLITDMAQNVIFQCVDFLKNLNV